MAFTFRILGGVTAGGLQVTVILFVSEIANDEYDSISHSTWNKCWISLMELFFFCRIRGRLGSFGLFMRNLGVLFGYVLGASIEYKYIPCICIVFPIIFVIVFTFLPNTPKFHLERGHTKVCNPLNMSVDLSQTIQYCAMNYRRQKTP